MAAWCTECRAKRWENRRVLEYDEGNGYQVKRKYLDDCVGVLAADVLRPSSVARWPSKASNNELGAFVKSGMSPLSIPTFCSERGRSWKKKKESVLTRTKLRVSNHRAYVENDRKRGNKGKLSQLDSTIAAKWHTSATFRNSPTLSIRTKNRLYKSNASLHCFLFMSKYFSNKLMMPSL